MPYTLEQKSALLILKHMKKRDNQEKGQLTQRAREQYSSMNPEEFAQQVIKNMGSTLSFYYFQKLQNSSFRNQVRAYLKELNPSLERNSWHFRFPD